MSHSRTSRPAPPEMQEWSDNLCVRAGIDPVPVVVVDMSTHVTRGRRPTICLDVKSLDPNGWISSTHAVALARAVATIALGHASRRYLEMGALVGACAALGGFGVAVHSPVLSRAGVIIGLATGAGVLAHRRRRRCLDVDRLTFRLLKAALTDDATDISGGGGGRRKDLAAVLMNSILRGDGRTMPWHPDPTGTARRTNMMADPDFAASIRSLAMQ